MHGRDSGPEMGTYNPWMQLIPRAFQPISDRPMGVGFTPCGAV